MPLRFVQLSGLRAPCESDSFNNLWSVYDVPYFHRANSIEVFQASSHYLGDLPNTVRGFLLHLPPRIDDGQKNKIGEGNAELVSTVLPVLSLYFVRGS